MGTYGIERNVKRQGTHDNFDTNMALKVSIPNVKSIAEKKDKRNITLNFPSEMLYPHIHEAREQVSQMNKQIHSL